MSTLADQLMLEFCQSSEDVDDRFSTIGRCVDILLEAPDAIPCSLNRVNKSIVKPGRSDVSPLMMSRKIRLHSV